MIKITYPDRNDNLRKIDLSVKTKQEFAIIIGDGDIAEKSLASIPNDYLSITLFYLFLLFGGYLIYNQTGALIGFTFWIYLITSVTREQIKQVEAYNKSSIEP